MFSFSTRADKSGFWYRIDATDDHSFTLSYLVIGTGGRLGTGEIRGATAKSKEWQYVEIGFPVLQVGITDFAIAGRVSSDSVVERPRLGAEGLSRRKALRSVATTLFAGGAAMLSSSRASALPGAVIPGSGSLGQRDDRASQYNPYGDERDDSFRPY